MGETLAAAPGSATITPYFRRDGFASTRESDSNGREKGREAG